MESMYTSASGVGGGSEADGLSLPVSRADDALHDSGHRGSFSSNRSPNRESNEHCFARARERVGDAENCETSRGDCGMCGRCAP